jgi:hypothetical protein
VAALIAGLAAATSASGEQNTKLYTTEQVRSVLIAVFHLVPRTTLIGQHAASAELFLDQTPGRRYVVEVTVDRSLRVTDIAWRLAPAWRHSGFAEARVNNVIVSAGPRRARLGVKARAFAMPPLVQEAIRRLSTKRA